MEGDVVNSVDVLEVGGSVHAMALECEIVLWIHRIEILNSDASFNGTKSVACGRFLLHVIEDGDATVLVLERTFMTLVLLRLILQRVDDHMTIGSSDNSHRIFDIGGVATFGQLELKNRILLSQVPKL